MTELEQAVIELLDGILAEMKAAREERADKKAQREKSISDWCAAHLNFLKSRSLREGVRSS